MSIKLRPDGALSRRGLQRLLNRFHKLYSKQSRMSTGAGVEASSCTTKRPGQGKNASLRDRAHEMCFFHTSNGTCPRIHILLTAPTQRITRRITRERQNQSRPPHPFSNKTKTRGALEETLRSLRQSRPRQLWRKRRKLYLSKKRRYPSKRKRLVMLLVFRTVIRILTT